MRIELSGSLRACWRLAELFPSSASPVLLPWDFYPLSFMEMPSPLLQLLTAQGEKSLSCSTENTNICITGAGFVSNFSPVNLYHFMVINANSSLFMTRPAPHLSFRAYSAFWYPNGSVWSY